MQQNKNSIDAEVFNHKDIMAQSLSLSQSNRSRSFPTIASLNALTPLITSPASPRTEYFGQVSPFSEASPSFSLHGPKRRRKKLSARSVPSTPAIVTHNAAEDDQTTLDWVHQLSTSLRWHRKEQQGRAYYVGEDEESDPHVALRRRESSHTLEHTTGNQSHSSAGLLMPTILGKDLVISPAIMTSQRADFSDADSSDDSDLDDYPSPEDDTIASQDPHGVYAWMERLFELPLKVVGKGLTTAYKTVLEDDADEPLHDAHDQNLTRLYQRRRSYSERMLRNHRRRSTIQFSGLQDTEAQIRKQKGEPDIDALPETDELVEGLIRAVGVLGRLF